MSLDATGSKEILLQTPMTNGSDIVFLKKKFLFYVKRLQSSPNALKIVMVKEVSRIIYEKNKVLQNLQLDFDPACNLPLTALSLNSL
jgi:hypothetical protein